MAPLHVCSLRLLKAQVPSVAVETASVDKNPVPLWTECKITHSAVQTRSVNGNLVTLDTL